MKKTLLFAGLAIVAASSYSATSAAPSLHLTIEGPSGKQEAVVSTTFPSVTSNGRSVEYVKSCSTDAASGKPVFERATVFDGFTVNVNPKLLDNGSRVVADVAAVNSRLKKMGKVEQGGCYIELPEVAHLSAEGHFVIVSGKPETMSGSNADGAYKVTIQLP